ncbi:MAG: 4-hydroxy-3-methylbut-2-enyl diphosphate reductase [Chitinophagales bacterium]|nr:4-hydroxy-3-methylbut-2-enyl diphosphate reductase [Chitinophagales bacterium]
MNVTIDPDSGFCFGVIYAIQMAEDELDSGSELYCLGDIVHNDLEVNRLTAKGLKIIDHEQFKDLRDCKVLIRAHGEPPETYITAMENNIELVDASCPVVLKLQNRVKLSYDKMFGEDTQLVIYGIPGHAEVVGLMGQTDQQAILITVEDDLAKIDFSKPIVFFSQTTKSTEKFYYFKSLIEERAREKGNLNVKANDTICRQVSNREPQLQKFAAEHDVIIFISGKKSSNGKVLYNVCKEINPHSYFISEENEIEEQWFESARSVGICGATSTPRWLMEKVAETIQIRYSHEKTLSPS